MSAAAAGAPTPPRLLTIAGSDSGGGAGIQADLKTFAAHGTYGMSVVTAITAQNTVAVTAVHPVPPEVVAAQIDAVFEDIGVDAVKIGMLADAPIIRAVADRLRAHKAGRAGRAGEGDAAEGAPGSGLVHVVLDPVMIAKSGDALLVDSAVEALVEELLPLATLVTPNLPEACRLLQRPAADAADEDARRALARELQALGPAALVKGGHGEGEVVVDLLFDGETMHRFANPRIHSRSTHGTGCTLSSAIAARLASGSGLALAVEGAIAYLRRAMETAFPLGAGHGPVNHLTPPE